MIRYCKAFAIIGALASLLIFTLEYHWNNLSLSIAKGFTASFVLVLFVLVSNRVVTRKIRRQGYNEIPTQRQSLIVKADIERLYRAVDRALDLLNTKRNERKSSENYIFAHVGTSWKSYGENIEILMREISANEWEISVVSRPLVPCTMFDYGKGFENVASIVSVIRDC
tara:strand:- start:69 stop:575 length:507 start_codon:yes stop_codon:yes gene_type:complete